MTSASGGTSRRQRGRLDRLRAWRPGRPGWLSIPRQGFSSLAAFLLLMAVVGVGVADARRTVAPGSGETDFIVWLTILGGAIGYVVARTSLGLVGAHLIGAAFGAAAILAAVSAALAGSDVLAWTGDGGIGHRMDALWDDLILLAQPGLETDGQRPWGFAMLVLGTLCWTTAQFGAMSIFRHGRALPAIGAAGVLLFLDILVPSPYAGIDPVLLAVAFAALSLYLFVRVHLAQQQATWARRSVTEGTDVSRLFIGAGAAFVVLTVVASTALTTFAVAERGTVPWQSLAEPLESVREQLLRVLEGLGVRVPPERQTSSLFASHQEIPERWDLGEGTAFRAETEVGGDPYWYGVAFDRLSRDGYDFTDPSSARVRDGGLAYGDLEIPPGRSAVQRETTSTTITPDLDGRSTLFGPATAIGVTPAAKGQVLQHVPGGIRIGVQLQPGSWGGPSYEVTSSELSFGTAGASLAADDLRAQDGRYPPVLDRFRTVPDDVVGSATQAFIQRMRRQTRGARDNPYDIARHVQDTLRTLTYTVDMTGVCGDRSIPDCLLTEGKGFCSHFALTMAVVLRELDIPTRIVHGYLPGEPGGDGRWTIPLQAAHAWVEVWFDDAGWIRFDPTPDLERFGGTGTQLPESEGGDGEPLPSLDPGLEPSPSPAVAEPSPSPDPGDEPLATGSTGGGPDLPQLALLVAAALALILVVAGGILVMVVRRLPGGDPTLAYRGVVRLASRFGYGPSPSQTEYEYAHSLGDTLPSVSEDLELVTRAHVETVYGGRVVAGETIEGLRRAYARVRTALLRLFFRR